MLCICYIYVGSSIYGTQISTNQIPVIHMYCLNTVNPSVHHYNGLMATGAIVHLLPSRDYVDDQGDIKTLSLIIGKLTERMFSQCILRHCYR